MRILEKAKLTLCLAAAVLSAGCVSLSDLQGQKPAIGAYADGARQPAGGYSREHREVVLQSEWAGRRYHALVAAYGPPRMLMRIPGDRPNESVAVYGVRDQASGCIDAFTVFHGRARMALSDESVVTHYFCR